MSSSMESRDVGVVRTSMRESPMRNVRSGTLWVIGGAELYRDMIENYRHLIVDCVISKIKGTTLGVHFPCLMQDGANLIVFM